ncbi:PAS domain-containing protein [Raineya orbicola]|jgi:PAS domain S-box-containing protein|uniref:histidine kinase n=1 Tax=Raineya orbicola TaxID=2016530 RepID=A0A2N3ICC4_9BACT|nr:PAS domain-containing protein [Raineya orbicola]PKQ68004.1 PAS domain S-box protein [Raineya orbicola]
MNALPHFDLDNLSETELKNLVKLLTEQKAERDFLLSKQEEIFQFYDRYKVISQMSREGLWEFVIPESFNEEATIWYSDEFIRLLGYEKENFPPFAKTFLSLIEPSQKEKFLQERAKFFRGELNNDIFETDLLLLTGTGEYKWYQLRSKIKRKKQGKAFLEVGVLRSIHSRKLAEQKLIESEKTLRFVSYASKDGIYDVDLINQEAYFSENFYFILGYSPQETQITWDNWLSYIHPEDRKAFTEAYNKFLLKKLNSFKRECRMLCKDGSYRWVLNRAKMVEFDKFGVPIRLVGTIANIQKIKESEDKLKAAYAELKVSQESLKQYNEELKTTLEQLQRMQEQLVQAEKMASLGTLVAGIAHELNNPIAYILGSAEGLKANINDLLEIISEYEKLNKENFDSQKRNIQNLQEQLCFKEILQETQDLIKNIRTGANQAAEIVRGLRSFTKSNDSVLEKTDLHEILDNSLALLQNQIKNQIEIEKKYSPQIPLIDAYPTKLSQVFMNLLINAIHAIEEKKTESGKIVIETKLIGNKVSVSITDSGTGIDKEKLKHIFEPFYTTKEIGKGTGLGLSISLGIIESLQGKINVVSELGKSSTFEVILPLTQS